VRYAVAAALALSIIATTESSACVPLNYGEVSYPYGSPTQQMVDRAASIELMRVERRDFVIDTGIHEYGAVYAYTLRSVETIAGRSRGRLTVTAFDSTAPFAQWRRPNQRWWDPPFDRVPNLAFPNIRDDGGAFGVGGCDGIADFQVGKTYLVFRDRAGAILRPTHQLHSALGDEWVNGPSFEPIDERNYFWLAEVREEVARQGPRQPRLLDWLFDAVIGPPRA